MSDVSTPKGLATDSAIPQLIRYGKCHPRCGKCSAPVNAIYARSGRGGLRWSKVGYVCLYCSQPFIDKKLIGLIGLEDPV